MTLATTLVVAAAIAAPALGANHHATKAHHATKTSVSVTAVEFKFKLSKTTVPAGSVTFTVKNKGRLPHDFKIAGKKTPLISPGKSAKLTVTLKKGKDAYLCTVPGHAQAGMKGTLTVK